VEYRVPNNWNATTPPELIPIDPTQSGWLLDKWRLNQAPTAPAAPVGKYTGNPKEAFWFFDEELAKATERYEAEYRALKPQLTGYLQDGKMVPQTDSHLQVTLKFEPEADGVTFKLSGAFYDQVPGGSPGPPGWTRLPVGSPLGHAANPDDITIDRICGPFKKISPDTFAVCFQKETLLVTNARSYEVVFAATHSGDSEHKPAVQQAHMFIPARNPEGAEQHITFPEIPDQKIGAKILKLGATSDANVPVHYFIRQGPAEIDGDVLKFLPVLPRAKLPVKVTVVAWQYGRSAAPKLKSAPPVERAFNIVR
jgi:hypothetical protein